MATSILVLFLALFVFGSSPIIELILKKRRDKEGDDIIGEPWQEIHNIPGYHDSRVIAAFFPLKGEPNIMPIIEELVREGRLLLPRCDGDGIMNFYKVLNLKNDLVKGQFGIMEPAKHTEKYDGDIPVFLIPGTQFNFDGKRIGHGKGYYDRFLAKHPHSYKAGIATPKQISKVPLEQKDTDVQMDIVIACKEKY